MNSNRKLIWMLVVLGVIAVGFYFGGGALWRMLLAMHGH